MINKCDYSLKGPRHMRLLLFLAPLVLLLNLLQLCGGPVVVDVEFVADLFRALAFDHVGDFACCEPEKAGDVQVVGGCDLKFEFHHRKLAE